MLRTIPAGKIHEAGNSSVFFRVKRRIQELSKKYSSPVSSNILFKKVTFYKPFTEEGDREYTSLRVLGLQDFPQKGPFQNSDSIRANYEETGVRLYAHVYRGEKNPSVNVFENKFSQGYIGFYRYSKEVNLTIVRRDILTVYSASTKGSVPKMRILYANQNSSRTPYQKQMQPIRLSKPEGREMTWKEVDS